MSNNIFLFDNRARLWVNVERCDASKQAKDGNMAHALWMLDIQGYRHKLRKKQVLISLTL